MTDAASFVARLADLTLPNVFNPYQDVCPDHDEPDAPDRRRANLMAAISAALDLNVRTIWIARDLGYRGGRRTGLALTDEVHLHDHACLLGGVDLRRSTRGPLVAERTATVIWRMVMRIEQPIFMWNVFPLHPHDAGEPMTNRCHTRAERDAAGWVLRDLLSLLSPDRVFTIGGDAKRGLEAFGINATAFRHPSYGGQTQFIHEVEAAYGLPTVPSAKLPEATQLTLDAALHMPR